MGHGAAQHDLLSRIQRVEQIPMRDLAPADRARFLERWRLTQARFVDDPSGAVREADALVEEVMRARGYPPGDFEQRAQDASVHHSAVVGRYRDAHRVAVLDSEGVS